MVPFNNNEYIYLPICTYQLICLILSEMISTIKFISLLSYYALCKKMETRKKFIKLVISLIILSSITASCAAVKCFTCGVIAEKTIIRNVTVFTPVCTKFIESDEFINDCPFSTMCLKTITTIHLLNGETNTITRGCAPQKDTTQVFKNRQWKQEHSVQEVYEDGCIEFKESLLSSSGKTYCYCRGDLCNSGRQTNLNNGLLPMSQILILCIYVLYITLYVHL